MRVNRFVSLLSLIALGACGETQGARSVLSPTQPNADFQAGGGLVILQGNGQTAPAGTTVPKSPAVQIRDANGNPVAARPVTFTTGAFGSQVGCPGGAPFGNTCTTSTDVNGIAQVTWKLSVTPGQNNLTASATVTTGTTTSNVSETFTATGTATTPATITIVNGNNQTAGAFTIVGPGDPGVQVKDANGTPLAGVPVTFIPSGSGQVTQVTVFTGSNGIALTRWRLSKTAGANTLVAQINGGGAGTANEVTFNATGTQVATSIAFIQGNNQTAGVGQFVTQSPTVQVLDASGAPLAVATTVTFAGQTGTPNGGQSTVVCPGANEAALCTATTNASGQVSVGWRFGAQPGTYALVATLNSNGGTAQISGTATGTYAQTFTIVQGNNQTAPASSKVPIDPSVLVKDVFGNPAVGAQVTFFPSGNSTVNPSVAITDSNGIARTVYVLGSVAGAYTLEAQINGGGGANSIIFSETATANGGAPTSTPGSIVFVQGNNQTGASGSFANRSLAVEVRDSNNNLLANTPVTFTASNGSKVSCGIAFATTCTVNTNASGIAQTGFQFGTAGVNNVAATTSNGLTITFTETAQ